MGRAARALAEERYSWDDVARRLEVLYETGGRLMRTERWHAARSRSSLLAVAISLMWWRGPDWHLVRDVFTSVSWQWVVAAVALNLLSIVVRAASWHTVIKQALPPPHPRFRIVFSAFCVGLFANVVLPGRVGELARVAVLARRMPQREGTWPTLIGTVFAHRLFDLFPALHARRLGAAAGEAAALGGHERRDRPRRRLRALHVRRDQRAAAPAGPARRARHDAHAARARRGSGSA